MREAEKKNFTVAAPLTATISENSVTSQTVGAQDVGLFLLAQTLQ